MTKSPAASGRKKKLPVTSVRPSGESVALPNHRVELPEPFKSLMRWEDLVVVDPRTLSDNPHNWKLHPPSQLDSAMAGIQSCGWVMPILYNLTTGRLIDGHGRKSKAIKDGLKLVPVARGRWTEAEELLLLQTMDSIGSMYKVQAEKLDSLTKLNARGMSSIDTLRDKHKETIAGLLSRTASFVDAVEADEIEATPLPLHSFPLQKIDRSVRKEQPRTLADLENRDVPETVERVIIDDVFFSGDAWGIPALDPSLLATVDMVPDRVYDRTPGSVGVKSYFCDASRPFKERYSNPHDVEDDDSALETEELLHPGGVLGFFTEDSKFTGYYDNAAATVEALQAEQWTALLAPDFSTYEDYPFPLRLWNLYRSRWVARYWQSFGMRIIPVLQNVAFRTPDGTETNLASRSLLETVGDNIPVVAVQCRTLKHHGGNFNSFGRWLADQLEMLRPRVTLIYGGTEHQGKFLGHLPKQTRSNRYVMLPSYMERRRILMNERRAKLKEKRRGKA